MLGFWLMLFTVKLYCCKDIFKDMHGVLQLRGRDLKYQRSLKDSL